ncbi:hypothetical protein SOVF_140310 [Spinacia oleracea]|uniref:Defensin-like protein 1 n=1 Tax=Spinacia oleracea TaxID=3562 RepID=A0A9R0I7W8_SPIOL|nr:defensin-like protein 1 [Spinacia oleracea]XP_056683483.1 defensin-like protein 1 [Spinacia oleracea]KNA10879.1 hypothetical protein SOVF_140310 [Spinacia oleracea]
MYKRLFGLCLLLVVLLASREVKQAEGRICQSRSHYFKGACKRDRNCAYVCRNEGFSGGQCHGYFHRRSCYCTKLC